ncbi:aminopeptidase RNPEPL1 [Vipera latastei]
MAAPETPPDVASASSASLFRLRHLRLGLDLRPEARALAGCLVLELCAQPAPDAGPEQEAAEGGDRRARRPSRVLVLDAHPALRVASVAFRACPAGETPCGFVFSSAGGEGEPGRGNPPPARPSSAPAGHPHPHCPLSSSSALSALGGQAPPEGDRPGPGASPDASAEVPPVWGEPPWACAPLESAEAASPPPLPAFPRPAPAARAPCPLFFRLDPFSDYGSALSISLPASLEPQQPFQVIVRYTAVDAPAIWWLDPELTYGNAKPFVFTQGHSVCNRSFFPCFDTPAVKCTYSAVVKAPAGMQVLMSATQSTYEEEEGVYQFYMEYPIPAYLVALVAGDLVAADVGPRSKVWAEPCLLSTAIGKLSGRVEHWLSAAESLYGPYIWGRYDIVFLPPSFPIVAMENPCLTFVISSILESDEFLIIDIIHEVAHSWFGNAVTNATWEEMWLSEGLATYAQRRITTQTYGAAFTCLETAFRLDALHRQMKLLGEDNPVSKLQVKLEPGVNPSNLMNLFTYEKGFCFVYYLSQLCGDPTHFDAFLRTYIEKYKFTSVVAQDLLDSFLAFFPDLKEQCIDCKTGLEFDRWLNATGPPLVEPELSQGSSLTQPVETLFHLWTTEPLDAGAAANSVDIAEWQTFQTVLFLDRLLDRSPLPHEVMTKLSECYSTQLENMNAEIRIRWLQIIVRNDYYPDLHKVRRFLENQMSRMYTIPLYEDLCTGTLKSFALEVFFQSQSQLHPNLRKTIHQILTQGLNPPLLATDTAAMVLDPPPTELEDRGATHSAVSLRDVNVSA